MQEGAQAPQRTSSTQCCLLRYMLLSSSHSHKTGWKEPHYLPPVLQVRILTTSFLHMLNATSHHITSHHITSHHITPFRFTGHKLSQKNSSIIILHYFLLSLFLSPTSSLLTGIRRACRTAMMQARISGKQFAYSILSYLIFLLLPFLPLLTSLSLLKVPANPAFLLTLSLFVFLIFTFHFSCYKLHQLLQLCSRHMRLSGSDCWVRCGCCPLHCAGLHAFGVCTEGHQGVQGKGRVQDHLLP